MERKGMLMKFNDFLSVYLFFLNREDAGKKDGIRCGFCNQEVYSNGMFYECCEEMKESAEKQREMYKVQRDREERMEKGEKDAIFGMSTKASGLDKSEFMASFKNYEKEEEVQIRNVNSCMEYCESEAVSLLLSGTVGTGKTHLAVATAKQIAYEGKKSYGILRCSKIFGDKKTVYDYVYSYDILIIDDIGREGGSEARSESRIAFVAAVIEERMRKRMKTIFTTNLKGAELKERYGAHILDRILESSIVTKRMEFDSFRTKN